MTRPTKAEVDEALVWADKYIVAYYRNGGDERVNVGEVLAAEVRALREELDATSLKWDEEVLTLRAAIARVEALPAKWRSEGPFGGPYNSDGYEGHDNCAFELEKALKDKL